MMFQIKWHVTCLLPSSFSGADRPAAVRPPGGCREKKEMKFSRRGNHQYLMWISTELKTEILLYDRSEFRKSVANENEPDEFMWLRGPSLMYLTDNTWNLDFSFQSFPFLFLLFFDIIFFLYKQSDWEGPSSISWASDNWLLLLLFYSWLTGIPARTTEPQESDGHLSV